MKKETQTQTAVSPQKQVTPAPTVSSGDKGFDQFVRQAMQATKLKINGHEIGDRTKAT